MNIYNSGNFIHIKENDCQQDTYYNGQKSTMGIGPFPESAD